MREIKFRAWIKEDEEMKGYMIHHSSPDLNYSEFIDTHNENKHIVLMQYTGLKANGVGIYEGDIVKVDYGVGKVIFHAAMFMIEWIDDKDANMESLAYSNTGYRLGLFREDLEVIGNIYQNPELLNK